jgi:hypothetical protein
VRGEGSCPTRPAVAAALQRTDANEASGHRGRASPSGSACDYRRHAGASFALAGRALRVPVAPGIWRSSRSTRSVPGGPDLRPRLSIWPGRSDGTHLPSSGPLGHIGATSGPRTTGSQRTTSVTIGQVTTQLTEQTRPSAAGRRAAPRIPDTEGVTGSNPVAPHQHKRHLRRQFGQRSPEICQRTTQSGWSSRYALTC